MTCIRSSRLMRNISLFLIGAVILPLTPLGIQPCQAQVDYVQKVLLFPVVDNTDAGVAELGRLATNKLQASLNELADVECTEFDSTSAIVRRAISERQLLPMHIEAGAVDPAVAITIGHILGMDGVIVASVKALQIQPEPRQVEVTIGGQYFLVAPNYDQQTDQPVVLLQPELSFTVAGTSKVRARYEGSNRPFIREALEDAAYKLKQLIAGRPAIEIAVERTQPEKKKNKWKWLAPV